MSKPVRFVFASDSHGDMADPEALAALFHYVREFKPDLVIAGGDQYDLRSLRRNASQKEQNEDMRADLDAGNKFMRDLAKAAPRNARKVWLPGNHEFRIDAALETELSNRALTGLQQVKDEMYGNARACGFKEILPYHAELGILSVGPGRWGHGYAFGAGSTIKQGLHYAPEGGFWMAGHDHTLAQINLAKFHGGVAFSAGCLCDILGQTYSGTRMMSSRWGNGFGAGIIDGNDYKVWLVHKVGRRWCMPINIEFWNNNPKNKG